MTLKKALGGIEIYLRGKRWLTGMLKNEMAKYPEDKFSNLCQTLINSLETDIEFLTELQTQLESPKPKNKKRV